VINHIFHNIIQNAIEASPRDSVVSIAVSTPGSYVIVNVTDSGPGMTEEEVSSLFDPLKVAAHGPHTKRSTGFGLYLSSMLAEGQGGTIVCQSKPQHGTKISIKLPWAPGAQQ
jgi:signal transduction histidine kinase